MNDPIGQAIHDYYVTGENQKINVDSNFTEGEAIESAWFFRSGSMMPPLEIKALELCKGNILDIGAGAGCHSIELQNAGMNVTALEESVLAAKVMRQRGIQNVINSNIYSLEHGNFDTILLLMNGAGIGGTLSGLKKLLQHLKTLLATDGQILLDSSDIVYLFTEDDGSVWIDLNSENYYGEMTYEMSYGNISGPAFPWLFVDFDTLSGLAAESGFRCNLIENGEHYDFLAQLKLN